MRFPVPPVIPMMKTFIRKLSYSLAAERRSFCPEQVGEAKPRREPSGERMSSAWLRQKHQKNAGSSLRLIRWPCNSIFLLCTGGYLILLRKERSPHGLRATS